MVDIAYLWPNKLHERNRARYQRAVILSQYHDVKLITRGTQPQNEEILSAVSDVYFSPSINQSNYLDNLTYYLYSVLVLIYLRLQKEIDAVHTFPGPSTHIGFCCKYVLGVAWVLDVLDDPSVERDSLQGKRPIIKYMAYTLHIVLAKRDFQFANYVIVVGWAVDEGLPSIVSERYNVSRERILPVPNGVDLDRTKSTDITPAPSDDEFVFFYVGSIKKVRGIDVLVHAFADFNETVANSRLEILGPVRQQKDEKAITDLLRELAISESVCFPATRINHDEVLERMARADVCVLPLSEEIDNYRYTFPIKLFEYLAMSKPVVATRLEGISQVIQNRQNGLLVEPGNSKAMSGAFEQFYRNSQLREKCAGNARDSIRQYDWMNINRSICKIYDNIAEPKI